MTRSAEPGDGGGAAPEWQRYANKLRASRERLQNLRIEEPAIPICIAGLSRIETMLRRPLRIAILGETNSGKTSVAGLLLANGLLPVNVLANTATPVSVSHGEEPSVSALTENGRSVRIDGHEDNSRVNGPFRALSIRLPLPWLRDYEILDTPATPAPAQFATDADIAIWCTVATRAWTESERRLWLSVPARCRRRAMLVGTHKDSFYSDKDCAQVMRRLRAMTHGLFSEILLVSAREQSSTPASREAVEPASSEGALLRAAVERSADRLRARRLLKSRQIVKRLARLSLQAFGRSSVRPEDAATLAHWTQLSGEIAHEFRAGETALESAVEKLLAAFAEAAEDLRPGTIRLSDGHPAVTGSDLTAVEAPGAPVRSAAVVRADLTAVLRILASSSSSEPTDRREQLSAARATLVTLAELDVTFAELGAWLASRNGDQGGEERTTRM